MKSINFKTTGVCAQTITFDIDDENKLHNVKFMGGCPGNLLAMGKLIEGQDAKSVGDILRGNDCRGKGTSCADQLARAIDQALNINN